MDYSDLPYRLARKGLRTQALTVCWNHNATVFIVCTGVVSLALQIQIQYVWRAVSSKYNISEYLGYCQEANPRLQHKQPQIVNTQKGMSMLEVCLLS